MTGSVVPSTLFLPLRPFIPSSASSPRLHNQCQGNEDGGSIGSDFKKTLRKWGRRICPVQCSLLIFLIRLFLFRFDDDVERVRNYISAEKKLQLINITQKTPELFPLNLEFLSWKHEVHHVVRLSADEDHN